MGYSISNADLAHVEAAQRVLLDPASSASLASWLEEASAAVQTLMQADAVHAFAAREGAPVQAGVDVDPGFFEGITAYFARAFAGDSAARDDIAVHLHMQQARAAGGPGVYHERALTSRAAIEASPFYQDVCAPHRIQYTTGISTPWQAGEAALCVAFTAPDAPGYAPAAGSLLRLLVPAFDAGLAYWTRLARLRGRLRRTIDTLADSAALFNTDGEEVHRNRALSALLKGNPASDAITEAAAAMAKSVCCVASGGAVMKQGDTREPRLAIPQHQVDGGGASYRLRACLLRLDAGGPSGVLITVEPLSLFPPPSVLERRFGLTPREAEVALLVAHGASNTDLAERLHISPHTARHHVASILKTLGVASRSGVASALLAASSR